MRQLITYFGYDLHLTRVIWRKTSVLSQRYRSEKALSLSANPFKTLKGFSRWWWAGPLVSHPALEVILHPWWLTDFPVLNQCPPIAGRVKTRAYVTGAFCLSETAVTLFPGAHSCSMANCQYGCDVVKGQIRCQCPSPGLQLAPDGRTCVGEFSHQASASRWLGLTT